MYHVFSPKSVKNAGISVIFTTKRIRQDRDREQQAELLRDAVRRDDERREDRGHDDCRRDDHATDRGDAVLDCVTRLQAVDVLLPDAAREEDHVVHREPEEDRERDRWHERLDRACPSRPVRPSRWPSWMTSVRTPNPMNAERIVVIAAVSETTIDRNAIASTRNVTPMM